MAGRKSSLGISGRKKKTVEAPGWKTKKIYFLERKEEESAKIRFLFQEFLKSGSLKETRQIGTEYQICTRNGKPYTTAALRNMLSNPVYCTADKEAYAYFLKAGCQMCMEEWEADGSRGFISYAKTVSQRYKGEETGQEHWILALGAHRGILTGKEYVAVQNILESHRLSKKQEANGIYQGQIHSRTALCRVCFSVPAKAGCVLNIMGNQRNLPEIEDFPTDALKETKPAARNVRYRLYRGIHWIRRYGKS